MKSNKLKELLSRATKGPWGLSQRPAPIVSQGLHIKCSDGRSIAVLGYQSDECIANAALIALTPDLAAELIRCRELLAVVLSCVPRTIHCDGLDAAKTYLTETEG